MDQARILQGHYVWGCNSDLCKIYAGTTLASFNLETLPRPMSYLSMLS